MLLSVKRWEIRLFGYHVASAYVQRIHSSDVADGASVTHWFYFGPKNLGIGVSVPWTHEKEVAK